MAELDLRSCEQEPIRIPGSIQTHGFLLALDPKTRRVQQASENAASHLKRPMAQISGATLEEIFGAELPRHLQCAQLTTNPVVITTLEHEGRGLNVLAHQHGAATILEFEQLTDRQTVFLRDLHPLVTDFVGRLDGSQGAEAIEQMAAEQVRKITEFDRVLVYRFDAEWNGNVIAESRNDQLPSYLDLRFPASDIPAQARELYRTNLMRLIPDVDYQPSPLVPAENPLTKRPLDLSFATLRSVSPIHREYMRNMGTAASMSISILREGQLWGLIACHNKLPKNVPFEVRKACEFIGQLVSVQMRAQEQNQVFAERVRLKTTAAELLAHMARHENFAEGLVAADGALLRFASAEGAAVIHGDVYALIGRTPSEANIRKIVEWLSDAEVREEVFHSDRLSVVMPGSAAFVKEASGLLAVRISKLHNSYVLWFRPEVVQTVRWGGDPTKARLPGVEQLHPRQSFETWKETVRSRSLPFSEVEVESALELRNSIVGIVLRQAEELAEIADQLRRSNKELESFSYSVSHDLRAPFRHIIGYAELLRGQESGQLSSEGRRFISTIIESAKFAGILVDNLLNFSRIARTPLALRPVNLKELVAELQREAAPDARGQRIEWKIGTLPTAVVDPVLIRVTLQNLISNAIKYSKDCEVSIIEIASRLEENQVVLWVRDNGVGFDMQYVDKLFGVFQRLHRMEDFEGTGIGLANVRRIVERHGGRTWAEGQLGKGATFYISLPLTSDRRDEFAEADSTR